MKTEEKYITESKMSLEEVGNYVSSEGIGYSLTSGLGYRSIEDPKLAKMWKQASDAIKKVEDYLGDYIFEM